MFETCQMYLYLFHVTCECYAVSHHAIHLRKGLLCNVVSLTRSAGQEEKAAVARLVLLLSEAKPRLSGIALRFLTLQLDLQTCRM